MPAEQDLLRLCGGAPTSSDSLVTDSSAVLSGCSSLSATPTTARPSPAARAPPAAAAPATTTLSVEGMMCSHCTGKVEQVLSAVAGVKNVVVDLKANTAVVTGSADEAALVAAVEGAGFRARVAGGPPTTTLSVEGMMCSHCTGKVEQVLSAVAGVEGVIVDLKGSCAVVTGSADEAALVEAVVDAGFKAALASGAADEAGGARGGAPEGRGGALAAEAPASLEAVAVEISASPLPGSPIPPKAGKDSSAALLLPRSALGTSPARSKQTKKAEESGGSVTLGVGGMTCDSCRTGVERCLAAQPGVASAAVSLMGRRALVSFDPSLVSPAKLAEAVQSLGFDATVIDDGESPLSAGPLSSSALSREALSWRRQFLGSLVFSVPVFVIAMALPVDTFGGGEALPGLPWRTLLLWLLVTPVQFGFGCQFYRRAFRALSHGSSNMDVLVALGSSAAYGYSVVTVAVAVSYGEEGGGQACFETASMLITFILLGKYLEASAKRKTSEALSKLVSLVPPTALLCPPGSLPGAGGDDGDEAARSVPVADLRTGDVVQVPPGAQLPVDGEVVHGSSEVNEHMVTGEPVPVPKAEGAQVIGGTLNCSGALWVRVGAVGNETVLAKIMKVVSDAQMRRPDVQAFADRISSVFVPAVVALALLTWASWAALLSLELLPDLSMHGWHRASSLAFMFGCAVLVIACPCAMGLATPTAVMVGTGVGAERGILFKGGDVLEAASRVTAVVFDKTGTLTSCKLRVVDAAPWLPGLTRAQLLELAGSAESASEHPIGKAIAAHARAQGLRVAAPECYRACAGYGLTCRVGASEVLLGNREWLGRHGVSLSAAQEAQVAPLEAEGKTIVLAARDGQLAGAVTLADTLKPEAAAVLSQLREMGVQLWICSGDNERTVRHLAQQLGVANFTACVSPSGKAEKVAALQAVGEVVAMVGDGINDAPALAQADLGVAIGGGTDVAIETADVVLLNSDLGGVAVALHLARAVMRRIRLNFVWAFGYNIVGLPLAAGLFYPAYQIHLPPMFAGAAMALSSVSVVCSSLLLRCYRPPKLPRHCAAQLDGAASTRASVEV